VRCGECLCIFDAMDGLSLPGSEALAAQSDLDEEVTSLVNSAFSDLDVTYADFDLFSEDADLPEIAYLDDTGESSGFDFASVGTDNDQTFSDTMFKHDVTINADIPIDATGDPQSGGTEAPGDESVPDAVLTSLAHVRFDAELQSKTEPLLFEYHDPDEFGASTGNTADSEPDTGVNLPAEPFSFDSVDAASSAVELQSPEPAARRAGRWVTGSVLLLLLALLLAGLYAYQERALLANNPRSRPLMSAACWVLRCELPALFDASKLRVLSRHVYTHPEVADALVVNVVFRNEAEFDQRFPVLVIKLSDIRGKLVASRDFQPAEYLTPEMYNQSARMAAKTSLDISLEIRDPGTDASSFEMEFR